MTKKNNPTIRDREKSAAVSEEPKGRIGIIGSGDTAQSLAAGFLKHKYEVMIGSRDPEKLKNWQKKSGKGIELGTFEDAAIFGDIIVLATKGMAAADALILAGTVNLEDKTVIDVTNPISENPPTNGVISFFTTPAESLMERLQQLVPEAHFVKAFNSVGNETMINPNYGGVKPTMFICGNDAGAKEQVADILGAFGWEAADMGGVEAARAIEPLCILWCIPGFLNNEWNHAFKLLRKDSLMHKWPK